MLYAWNVIGHEKQLEKLEKDIASGNIPHAYLFVGPEKIGKFRVAKNVASVLQCPNNFCHACPVCIQIEKKTHPDTVEIKDDHESIKIDRIREIISWLNMTTPSRYKFLLIENIARATEEAGNCLLKTLEEPPDKTIFIFTVGSLRDIMPTISSRMRIVHFKKLPDDVLRTSLRQRYPEVSDEILNQVLILSLGRSGKAIKLLSQPEAFQELHDLYRHIQFLDEQASPAVRMAAVREISQDADKMKTFLSFLTHYLRHKMFSVKSFDKRRSIIEILEEIPRVTNLVSYNVNPRLLLENLMLKL